MCKISAQYVRACMRKVRKTGGRRPGRRVEQTDGESDGRTESRTDGRTESRTDGRTESRTDGRRPGRTDITIP